MLSLPRIKLPALPKVVVPLPKFTTLAFSVSKKLQQITSQYTGALTSLQAGLVTIASSTQPAAIANTFKSVDKDIAKTVSSTLNKSIQSLTGSLPLIAAEYSSVLKTIAKQNTSIQTNIVNELTAQKDPYVSVSNLQGEMQRSIQSEIKSIDTATLSSIISPLAREQFANKLTTQTVDNLTTSVLNKLSYPSYTEQVSTLNQLQKI